jgi:hypothetical protein
MAIDISNDHYQGDAFDARVNSSDYPAPTWTHTVTLTNANERHALTADDSGMITASSTITTLWSPGNYRWSWTVSDGTNRYTLEQGDILINHDPTKAHDQRTMAQRMVDAIEATMEGKVTADVLTLSHKDKSVTRLSPAELMDALFYWKTQLVKEKNRARRQAGKSNIIHARFV